MKGLWILLGAGVLVAGCSTIPGMRDRSELVTEPEVCTPKRFEVYFRDSEAGLTEAARQAIGLTATQLQGCNIRAVQVIGLADARGGPTANLDLSERRALAVADALMAAGWPSPVFNVVVAGESGSVTAEGASEPMRRRTEVVVDAAPR
ncbi:outer membrane protein OmpA-like peptidoglycan-associated protein [Brevundimonas alba]|uniref:Outer membrane protein OmpA-like peptidoglycan-associated protein n=1 Tax=Brevundimonas alba TaxID=74314 RepID=A0A7X5YJ28_9CAUL|nr:OmpA family protein [Brevundimonas alba]NJC40574.1 outer membrane protein OmpA-like peptidoglycan-associated protein [Brevundimonas alba]